MDKVEKRLLELERISTILEPSTEERKVLSDSVFSFLDEFIERLDTERSFYEEKPNLAKFRIDENPTELEDLIDIYVSDVVKKGINAASGGHLGYIPGGGLFVSALGDSIAAVTNEYAGMHFASPGAVAMEHELLRWLGEIFGFPEETVGNLTSGGSIANLIALTAARDHHGIKNEQVRTSVIYMTAQVHHCIQKALRIIGLEDVIIRYVELDQNHRMDVSDLDQLVQTDLNNGLKPFMVIASAGTTDTGTIDSLKPIGEVARAQKLWYHIDAAYGGFFMLLEDKKHLFEGIEMADSLVVDPHKGLFLPYGIGAVLVKEKESVFHSHHYRANYMQDAVSNFEINPADVSPELTKHYRALRMWLPIKLYGLDPFKACLEEKLLLTEIFRSSLKNLGFSLGPIPDLTVSYFWYPSTEVDENSFNQKLMEFIHKDGSVFLSSTTIGKKFVIRMAILSFRTKKKTIEMATATIAKCLEKTKDFFNEKLTQLG